MEDQIIKLKAKLFDKSEEVLTAQTHANGVTSTLELVIKCLQDKLELTDEEIRAYGSTEDFLKELDKLVLIKEEVEATSE